MKSEEIKEKLSNREFQVAEIVTSGLPNLEVANRLFINEKTVKFHLTNIYKKLKIKNRSQLVLAFVSAGLLNVQNENIVKKQTKTEKIYGEDLPMGDVI